MTPTEFLVKDRNWIYAVTAAVSGGMLLWPLLGGRFSSMKEIGTQGATQLMNRDALVLDLRETKELADGKLPSAVHIPLSELDKRVGELAKYVSRPVVAYTARGQRNRGAGGTLTKAGFKDVYNLAGGLAAWRGAGLPVVK